MELDWTLYWFMFPVAMCVTTTAMLSGVGGATLFTPIFLVAFPLLGPQYPLQSTAASIGAALLTMVFGFSSGFIGYWRRGLIDYRSAVPFMIVSVPVTVVGAILLARLRVYDAALMAVYAALILVIAMVIGRRSAAVLGDTAPSVEPRVGPATRTLVSRDGEVWRYAPPRLGAGGTAATAVGAFLTGLLGVGIGEVVMPQLIKRNRVPLPVAAGTSVFAVIVTILCASAVQVATLGPGEIPWNLVCYTIPGVVLGGQIGPRLQGKVSQRVMERAIASLFVVIGLAMAYLAFRRLGIA